MSEKRQFKQTYSNWEKTFYGFGANNFWIVNGKDYGKYWQNNSRSEGTTSDNFVKGGFDTKHFKQFRDTFIDKRNGTSISDSKHGGTRTNGTRPVQKECIARTSSEHLRNRFCVSELEIRKMLLRK